MLMLTTVCFASHLFGANEYGDPCIERLQIDQPPLSRKAQATGTQVVQTPVATESSVVSLGTIRSLAGRVKVIIDQPSNTLTLVGAPSDVEIVKRTIQSLQSKLARNSKLLTIRVTLENQLAEIAAETLRNSINDKSSSLKINAVSFPEAIILVGPKLQVLHARKILWSIDSILDVAPSPKASTSESTQTPK